MAYQLKGGEEWIDGVLHGWTGRKCPRCGGSGQVFAAARDNECRCGACGGTGEEHSVMPVQPASAT